MAKGKQFFGDLLFVGGVSKHRCCLSFLVGLYFNFFVPLPHILSSFLALSLALPSSCVSAAVKIAQEVLK